MKIVHAADLHLDSPLRGLSNYEGAPVSEVRSATRVALTALVDLCLEESAALLLIAGDLYDGDFRDYSTALFFTEQMARLRQSNTRVVWIRGNHDAANRITKHLRTADHVFELSHGDPETRLFEDLGVAIHGQGYATRDTQENLARRYPAALADFLNIGLLHTALDGREGHAPYAPCSVADLKATGYQYWALGHVHQREVVSEEPWIVFPGNPQGRHIKETGPKGVTVIHTEGGQITRVEPKVLDTVRWELAEVDVSDAVNLSEVLDRSARVIDGLRDKAGGRILATRVRLVGASAAHGVLANGRDKVEAELRAHAVSHGDVFLERVRVATVGQLSAQAWADRRDALGDLFRAVEATQSDPEARGALWDELLRPLSGISADLLRDEVLDPAEVLAEAARLLEGRLLSSSAEDDA